VAHLLAEREATQLRRRIATAYARLRETPKEWVGYAAELDEWDGVSADSGERRG